MKQLVFCFSLLLALGSVQAAISQYDGLRVVRVTPQRHEEELLLQKMYRDGFIDIWATRPDGAVDVMLDEKKLERLHSFRLQTELLIDDLSSLLEGQLQKAGEVEGRYGNITWLQYNTLAEIYDYMDYLATTYPDVATIMNLGTTWEGRNQRALVLAQGGDDGTRPVFFLDAGFHAREWIAPAVATYFMDALINDQTGLLDLAVWVIAPSMNPDGYEFTWTSDRFWRKTRSDRGDLCLGVDPNRNFDFHWMEVGASDVPCSETYAGPSALSESECINLANYMVDNQARVQVYITLHSYSQLFMYPFGYTEDLPEDWEELDRVAKLATEALTAVHGTQYGYGSVSSILYMNSGSSRDYVKGVIGAPYVYTIELRDQGEYGFALPPEQILPTCEETWEAIKVVAREAFPN